MYESAFFVKVSLGTWNRAFQRVQYPIFVGVPIVLRENKSITQDTSSIDLSILIVSWNSWTYLVQCLKSLEDQRNEAISFEVIVVDNASIDGTPDLVTQHFPWVVLIRNDYNYGFARATNQAYRVSRGRYIMTLNPDTKLPPGSLKNIVDFFDNHPDAGAAQPWPTYTLFNRIHETNFWKIIKDRLSLSLPESPPTSPRRVEWLWGTAITARREVLLDKFYSEWSFLFCEEYDFCLLIRKAGYHLYVLPFCIDHFLGGSRKNSFEIQRLTQHLAQAAIFMIEIREVGKRLAWLNSLLRVIDGLVLWLPLAALNLFRRNSEREKALIEWEVLWKANLKLLLRGKAYFEEINTRVEQTLNNKHLLRDWLGKDNTFSSSKEEIRG